MYKELGQFVTKASGKSALVRDGELWTSVIAALAAVWLFNKDPTYISRLRSHLGDLLTILSLAFGFILAAHTFYVAAIAGWAGNVTSGYRQSSAVRRASAKLVSWNTWAILWTLITIAWVVVVWTFDQRAALDRSGPRLAAYGGIVFGTIYVGCQALNQALTLWWFHGRVEDFVGRTESTVENHSDPKEIE